MFIFSTKKGGNVRNAMLYNSWVCHCNGCVRFTKKDKKIQKMVLSGDCVSVILELCKNDQI